MCSQPLRAPRVTVWHASRSSAPDAALRMPRLSRRASPRRRSRNGDRSLRRRLRGEGRWGRRGRVARRGDRSVSPSPYLRRPGCRPCRRPAPPVHRLGLWLHGFRPRRRSRRFRACRCRLRRRPRSRCRESSAESGTGGRGSALAEKSSAPADRASGGRGARTRPELNRLRAAAPPPPAISPAERPEPRPAPPRRSRRGRGPDQAGAGDMSGGVPNPRSSRPASAGCSAGEPVRGRCRGTRVSGRGRCSASCVIWTGSAGSYPRGTKVGNRSSTRLRRMAATAEDDSLVAGLTGGCVVLVECRWVRFILEGAIGGGGGFMPWSDPLTDSKYCFAWASRC